MKKRNCIAFALLSIFVIGCSSDKQSSEELPYFDVTKSYPEKEILLSDIADMTYVQLDKADDDYLYRGSIDYITQNTIVVIDRTSYSVLFFSKEGNPKSRFNRRGQGPEEYRNVGAVIYDEATDDVYVAPGFSGSYINVYSSSGTYKRKLNLPQGKIVDQMFFFDDQSILVRDLSQTFRSRNNTEDKAASAEQFIDSTFFLVSKTDGTVLEYINMKSNNIDLTYTGGGGAFFGIPGFAYVRKSSDGFYLFNPETDTIFHYNKDKLLTPFLHKIPLLNDLDPLIAMNICMDTDNYQFMTAFHYAVNDAPSTKYYMRDKKTGEIFQQKITHPDYQGKEFYIDPRNTVYLDNEYHFELDVFELKEAYKENKLSGKLKELVATLNDDEDNNVFMLVDFK